MEIMDLKIELRIEPAIWRVLVAVAMIFFLF